MNSVVEPSSKEKFAKICTCGLRKQYMGNTQKCRHACLLFSVQAKHTLSVSLGSTFCAFLSGCIFLVGLVHCLWDLQVLFSTKTTLKLGPTALFTHLKIILLQCFQFSVISNIQIDS